MNIQRASHQPPNTKKYSSTVPKAPKKSKKTDINSDFFNGELQELGLHLSPENIEATVEGARALGESLRKTWSSLREKVIHVFSIDKDASTFDPEFREKTADFVVNAAKGLGYTAAGIQGIGGAFKLASGIKNKDLGKTMSSAYHLATSAAVATTVAGLAVGPLILSPIAAGLGVVRGGFGMVKGFLEGDTRKEVQGALDATRSARVGLRLASGLSTGFSAGLATASAALGPVASLIQFARGHHDLSEGLQTENKQKQWKGLADITSAAGLTLALTGVGTIPGIALTSLAMGSRLLYQFNDNFENYANNKLDSWQPTLEKSVETVNTLSRPAILAGRTAIEWAFGKKRGEDRKAEQEQRLESKAQANASKTLRETTKEQQGRSL